MTKTQSTNNGFVVVSGKATFKNGVAYSGYIEPKVKGEDFRVVVNPDGDKYDYAIKVIVEGAYTNPEKSAKFTSLATLAENVEKPLNLLYDAAINGSMPWYRVKFKVEDEKIEKDTIEYAIVV